VKCVSEILVLLWKGEVYKWMRRSRFVVGELSDAGIMLSPTKCLCSVGSVIPVYATL